MRPPLHAVSVSLSSPRKRISAAIFCSTVARCRPTNRSTAAQELSCRPDRPNSSRTSATENPKLASAPNEAQPAQMLGIVTSVVPGCAIWFRQQPDPLVVADCLDLCAGCRCQIANFQVGCFDHALDPVVGAGCTIASVYYGAQTHERSLLFTTRCRPCRGPGATSHLPPRVVARARHQFGHVPRRNPRLASPPAPRPCRPTPSTSSATPPTMPSASSCLVCPCAIEPLRLSSRASAWVPSACPCWSRSAGT